MSPKTPTLAEVLRTAIENRLAEVHVMMPGKVTKYDAANQKVDVQPMINRFQKDEVGDVIEETLPVIPSVPVAFPRGGGYKLTFPLVAGDTCMLVFCESSIDNYQAGQARDPSSPELFQRFDLTDAVAIPGWYPDAKALAEPDGDAMVLGLDSLDSDFVALAQKVLDELNAAKTDRVNFKSAFDTHTHITTATVSVGPPGVLAPPASPFPTPTDPNPVAAEKVKAT